MTAQELKTNLALLGIRTIVRTVRRGDVDFIAVQFLNPLTPNMHTFLTETLMFIQNSQGSLDDYVLDSSTDHFHCVLPKSAWYDIITDLQNQEEISTQSIGIAGEPSAGLDRAVRFVNPTTWSSSWTEVGELNPHYVQPLTYEQMLRDDTYISPTPTDNQDLHCVHCSRKKRKNEGFYHVDSKFYCKKDFTTLFQICNSCHARGLKTDMKDCFVCTQTVCANCTQYHDCFKLKTDEQEARRNIFALAKKRDINLYALQNPLQEVAYKFIKGNPELPTDHIKVNRFVGTELEVEQGTKFGLNVLLDKNVGIAHDGSLDKNTGIEIQTPPSSLNELERVIKNTCQVLKSRGYKSTIKCGLHVHLDARDFRKNHAKILQVIKTFYSIEDMIFSILPPSRWTSKYCQQLSKEYKYDTFSNGKKADEEWYKENSIPTLNVRKDKKYDKSRYYGLNIHSIFHRGTLELRYHSGTTNEYKILMWTNFCLKVLDYALNQYDADKIQELFDMETSWNKFDLMVNTFQLPNEMANYLLLRIKKFNPNFHIKFNQGKNKRVIEEKESTKLHKAMQDKKAQLYPKIANKVKETYIKCFRDFPDFEHSRDFIASIEVELNRQMKQLFPTTYGILPVESGFIKNEEIIQVISLIEQGRNLQRGIATDDDEEIAIIPDEEATAQNYDDENGDEDVEEATESF